MGTKLGITGLIGLGCVAAAAGGGYLALRSNAADLRPAPLAESAQPTPAPAPANAPAVIPDAAPGRALATATVPSKRQAVAASEVRTAASSPVAPEPTPAVVNPPSGVDMPAAGSVVLPATLTGTAPATAATPPTPVAPTVPPPPSPRYDAVTVAADAVLGLRLESTISSQTAHVEDRVNARLSRDVLVDGRVAIAAGARLEGTVTLVDRGGKYKERPRLGIAFNALVLADGTRVAIQTEPIYRDGDSPSGQAATKVGGSAVVGAILGAMIGGKKGAVIGTAAGAVGGAAAVAAGDHAEAALSSGTPVTARLNAPVTLLIERDK